MADMTALRALLGMVSPANMTPTGDPYADKRRAQTASGEDAFAPSEVELLRDQNTPGIGTFGPAGGPQVMLSRDTLRDSGIQALSRALGVKDIESRQKTAELVAPKQVEGEYGLAKERLTQGGLADVHASEAEKNRAEAKGIQHGAAVTDKLLGGGASGPSGGGAGVAMPGSGFEPHIDAKGGVAFAPVHDKPLNAQATNSLTALNEVKKLGPQILAQLEQQYPGIGTNPGQYGGVLSTGEAALKKMLYNAGLYQKNETTGQLEQLMKVIAARPYMQGRPNQRVYQDIVSHLGDIGFSPGADYSRIKQLVDIAPELEQSIAEVENPDYARSLISGAKAPLSDPHGLR